MEVDDCPLCDVCHHHHHEGVKCTECGHVGRSKIYAKMKIKASEYRQCSIKFLEAAEIHADWDVIYELRKILAIELGINAEEEFKQGEEEGSVHMLAYKGDSPLATARYHFETIEEINCVIVDRFVIFPHYRRQNYARKCLQSIVEHAQATSLNSINCVVFSVPEASTLATKLQLEGCVAFAGVANQVRGGVTFTSFALSLASNTVFSLPSRSAFGGGGGGGVGRGGSGGGVGGF